MIFSLLLQKHSDSTKDQNLTRTKWNNKSELILTSFNQSKIFLYPLILFFNLPLNSKKQILRQYAYIENPPHQIDRYIDTQRKINRYIDSQVHRYGDTQIPSLKKKTDKKEGWRTFSNQPRTKIQNTVSKWEPGVLPVPISHLILLMFL